MNSSPDWMNEHSELSRRYFLGLGVAATSVLANLSRSAAAEQANPELDTAIAKLEYLTKPESFGTVERGTPLPYTHPV